MGTFERICTDVLILGSGGAGLFAALHAKQASPDLRVVVAAKGLLGRRGCTPHGAGRLQCRAAPQATLVERHFMDTIEGGKWLPRPGPRLDACAPRRSSACSELENELGCFFDRNHDGSLHLKAFAGQSFDRTVHKGDLTGIEIMNRSDGADPTRSASTAWKSIERSNCIRAKDQSGIAGVLMIDIRTGNIRLVQARAVLLATGAGPTMYTLPYPLGR